MCINLIGLLKQIFRRDTMIEYNIFEERERGSYTPGFFLMKLSFPFDTNNLSELSKEDLGTFAHEYIHFLQNTSTPYGLWQAMIFYQLISEVLAYAQKVQPKVLPISGYTMSDVMKRRLDLEKEATGCRDFIKVSDEEEISIREETIELQNHKISRIILTFKDIYGFSLTKTLGAHIIKESMAAMVQELINPGSQTQHDAIPYRVVERIANKYALNISWDIKKLIGLCFISLHTLCPGKTLYDYLLFANANPTMSIIDIFNHFIKNSIVKTSGNKHMSIVDLGNDIVEAFKKTLQSLLIYNDSESQSKYLFEILDRVKISNGMIPLLRLINEQDIDAKLLQEAVNACGTPVIWSESGCISIPNTTDNKGQDMDIWALITYQSIYKILIDKRQLVCPMYPICQCCMNRFLKDECYGLPWQGNQCMMTITGQHIGLH